MSNHYTILEKPDLQSGKAELMEKRRWNGGAQGLGDGETGDVDQRV